MDDGIRYGNQQVSTSTKVNKMVEVDTCQRHTSPDKREHKTTVYTLCVWAVVLGFCWVFLTTKRTFERVGSAVAYLMMWSFVMAIFFISIYKTGKAISNLYKHR